MKKLLIIALSVGAAFMANAQENEIESIQKFLGKQDLESAKKIVDEATQKYAKESRLFLLKGAIYQTIADDEKKSSLAPDGHSIALEAYKKYISLDPKYKLEQLKPNIMNLGISYFNKGINSYNGAKYADAISSFNAVTDVMGLEGGKFTKNEGLMDTLAMQAKMYKGYAYYNDRKYEEAKSVFEPIADNPIIKDIDIYKRLSSIYQQLNDNIKWRETLDKIAAGYPSDKDLLYEEINYFATIGKPEMLITKLEEATVKEPKNAEMFFNLGATIESVMKNSGTTTEMLGKAAKAYDKAVELEPAKGDYIYNLAALYWNQAVPIGAEMNKVLKDQKKYDELRKTLVAAYLKAQPHFEKAIAAYEKAGGGTAKEADRANYRNSLKSLQTIYSETKNPLKDAITKKLSAL
jgi:tetratricopeptide (TPR) repeat protein